MKLSVIVSAYKFAPFLEQCLLSILWQKTDFEFEVIVADDHSPDKSQEIIDRISQIHSNLRVIRNKNNIGFYENIKNLIKQSDSEYISHLDGDDYLTNQNKLQNDIDFLDKNPHHSMVFCGTRHLLDNSEYVPRDIHLWLGSLKDEIKCHDLLENNYVGFGRTWRNYRDLFEPWMEDLPYLDWTLNYQISKRGGPIKYLDFPGGVYRITGAGIMSTLSEEKKQENNLTIQIAMEKNYRENMRTITILDCFVSSGTLEEKLTRRLDELHADKKTTLLVSNTRVNPEILKKTDYYLYDCNNRLFEKDYEDVFDINLYKRIDNFMIHELNPGIQRHGLSVIVNLFNCLNLAKSLGFTHFERLEIDDIFGVESKKYLNSVPIKLLNEFKRGLFYFNEGRTEPDDVSFHYFFCEIDFFLHMVPQIKSEEDYMNFLLSKKGKLSFMSAETFIYENIKEHKNELIAYAGEQQMIDFPDTVWNTEVSDSNLPSKYKGCSTKIYQLYRSKGPEADARIDFEIQEGKYVIFTYSYTDSLVTRKLKITYESGRVDDIEIILPAKRTWHWVSVEEDIKHIEIFENEERLFLDDTINFQNRFIWT
jgi:glycosyltransferase involved in cell wall biosynthesis